MCRCACPAPHFAPAALTPGRTSHSGSNEGKKVNVFGEMQEEEDREGRGGGQGRGRRDKMKNILKMCFTTSFFLLEVWTFLDSAMHCDEWQSLMLTVDFSYFSTLVGIRRYDGGRQRSAVSDKNCIQYFESRHVDTCQSLRTCWGARTGRDTRGVYSFHLKLMSAAIKNTGSLDGN